MKIKPPPVRPEPEPPPKFGRFFWCMTCGQRSTGPSMTKDELKRHLIDVHGFNGAGSDFQGNKRAIMHADARTFFVWRWEWNIGNVVVEEVEVSPRKRIAR